MVHSVVEAVFQGAARHPEKLCVADDNTCLTYAQYTEKVKCFAAFFKALGVGTGDKVVIEACQTVDYLAVELALHLIGAVFVPAEHNCGTAKLEALAALVNAAAVISTAGETKWQNTLSFDALAAAAANETELDDYTFPTGDEVSEILFSTGTTGKEKGIILTHRNDIAIAENVIAGVAMEEDNVELIPSPLNHSHGLRRYYANMLKGAGVVLVASIMNLMKLFALMDEYAVTAMDLVPTALSVILKLSKNKLGEYKDRLRYIQFGAAPLMEADKEKICSLLPDTRLYNFYGSTESGCIIIYNFNTPHAKPNCIGKPAVNATITIVDDARRPIASSADNTGLLAAAGPMNMSGYYEDEEETKAVLDGGTVYTNDVAYIDEDGDIILLGRQGSVINVGGKKVSPDEIENAAKLIKGVVDCGCVPTSDPLHGEVPKLFVQTRSEAAFDPVFIRNELAKTLEPFKIPKYIVWIQKIPRTFNGKLIRRELQ